jgi:Fe-S-cluster-containing dehydrogenase component
MVTDSNSGVQATVLARLTGKGIVCPDCHKICNDVNVERYDNRIYKIDWEAKKLVVATEYPNWSTNDWSYRCPHCDSLNIDEEVRKLELEKPDFSA